MGTNTTKVTQQVRITKIIAGITQYFMKMSSLLIGGTSYTPADLVAKLQAVLAAIAQSSNSKAAWLADAQTERNLTSAITPVLGFIKSFVENQFGNTQDAGQKLEVFGFTPKKQATRTVAMKVEAVAQGKATRVARGTKGPKAKLKIKGTIAKEPSNGSVADAPATAASTAPAPIKTGP